MKRNLGKFVALALGLGLATESFAEEWNVSTWGKRRAFTEHIEKLAELVSAKTNGEFTMNVSYGGLSKNREKLGWHFYWCLRDGTILCWLSSRQKQSNNSARIAISRVETLDQEVAVSHAVYDHPAVKDEMAQWNAKIIMTSPMPQYNLVGTGEPRDTLAEFNGMRVRATGGLGAAFKAVGGVPTSVTATEAYQAMEAVSSTP